jgi:hypothetical protein
MSSHCEPQSGAAVQFTTWIWIATHPADARDDFIVIYLACAKFQLEWNFLFRAVSISLRARI